MGGGEEEEEEEEEDEGLARSVARTEDSERSLIVRWQRRGKVGRSVQQ